MTLFKNLITFFLFILTVSATAQLKHTKHFVKQNETLVLCNKSIVLDSSGYFFKEQGCEGRGTISFGSYKVSKNNVVTFHFLPFDSLAPIRQIKHTSQVLANDSLITITLFDRENKPLAYNFNVLLVGKDKEPLYPSTDEKGQIILNKNQYQDIFLNSLQLIYNNSPTIINGDESAIEVYLNLPELFLISAEITVEKQKSFQLLLKKDGLYKLNGKTLLYQMSK